MTDARQNDLTHTLFADQCALAADEAEEVLKRVKSETHPGLGSLYLFATNAFASAVAISKMSRARTQPEPSDCTSMCARIEENLNRISQISQLDSLFNLWPTDYGVTFSWKAGVSVLDVALKFAHMIAAAAAITRANSCGLDREVLHRLRVAPHPDAKIVQWRDLLIHELRDKTLPPMPEWPMWQINRDSESLWLRLAAEYTRAFSGAGPEGSQSSRTSQAVMCSALEQTARSCVRALGRYESLRPKLLSELPQLRQQAGGPWTIQYRRKSESGLSDGVPFRAYQRVGQVTELGGQPIDGIVTMNVVEACSDFYDFTLLDSRGEAPPPDSPLRRMQMQLQFLLTELLAADHEITEALFRLERDIRQIEPNFDVRPLTRMRTLLPAFPYWPDARLTKDVYEQALAEEAPVIRDARRCLEDLLVEISSKSQQWESSSGLRPGPYIAREYAATRRYRFDVALSFPGERREYVSNVAALLAEKLTRDRVLYDKNLEAELARPDLDTYLQRLYHDESELLVIFLCQPYVEKEWCGLEWRAVRDLMKQRRADDVMLFRFDLHPVPGTFSIDGYIDLSGRKPDEAAALIMERLTLNRSARVTEPYTEPEIRPGVPLRENPARKTSS